LFANLQSNNLYFTRLTYKVALVMGEINNIRDSIPKSKLRIYLLFVVPILLVIGMIIYSNYWQSNQPITEIKITGNKYLSKTKIQNKIYQYVLTNNSNSLNYEFIRNLILQNPFINKCDFNTNYPNKIIISLDVKNILAKGKDENGIEYYLTESGEMIKKGDVRVGFNLPTIDFAKIPKNISNDNNQKNNNYIELAKFLKKYYLLEKLEVKAKHIWWDKEGVCFTILDNIVVRVGNLTSIEEKFLKFEIFFNTILKELEIKPNFIDLRWSNQVVTN